MRLIIFILFVLSVNAVWAGGVKNSKGIGYPEFVIAVNSEEHSAIEGACKEISDSSGDISCKFEERTVFHADLSQNTKWLHALKDDKEFKKILDVLKSSCSNKEIKINLHEADLGNHNKTWTQEFNRMCLNLNNSQVTRDEFIKTTEEELKKD